MISLNCTQACPQTRLLGAGWYKVLKVIHLEYLQPNNFKEGPSVDPIYQVSCFSSLGDASCFHVFPGKGRLSLPAQGKKSCFREKNTIFPDNAGKIMCRRCPFSKDHLFRVLEEIIIFSCIF